MGITTGQYNICTGIQHLTPGEEHSEPYKRALTLAMIDEQYPDTSWTQVYTDGSATNAVENGRTGIYIMDPSGYREEAHFPRGKHCTNYAAEVEALIHAANMISTREANCSYVVFLTDALSALQLLKTTNLTYFQKLYILSAVSAKSCYSGSLLTGIPGNENADRLANLGAAKEKETHLVTYEEMKSHIKSPCKPPKQTDDYYLLSPHEQVIIFRLRTGHNKLNQHMYKRFRLVPSSMCSCGESEQTTVHVIQDCINLQQLRETTWTTTTTL